MEPTHRINIDIVPPSMADIRAEFSWVFNTVRMGRADDPWVTEQWEKVYGILPQEVTGGSVDEVVGQIVKKHVTREVAMVFLIGKLVELVGTADEDVRQLPVADLVDRIEEGVVLPD